MSSSLVRRTRLASSRTKACSRGSAVVLLLLVAKVGTGTVVGWPVMIASPWNMPWKRRAAAPDPYGCPSTTAARSVS